MQSYLKLQKANKKQPFEGLIRKITNPRRDVMIFVYMRDRRRGG